MRIRREQPVDIAAVHAVNRAAFGSGSEAALVDALRAQAEPIISLVAEDAGSIVGHICFSPVTLLGHAELKIMGLAPMAVLPAEQRRGIGSALVRSGPRLLQAARMRRGRRAGASRVLSALRLRPGVALRHQV